MNERLRAPIRWFGGKGNFVKNLLNLMPPHKFYVEVFGGGASLLFAKQPAEIEVYNDIDSGLVNFFRVIRDPSKFAEFYHKATLTLYSREEYYYARDNWRLQENAVEKAYLWFIVARQCFSGVFGGGWSFSVTASNRKMAETVSKWLSILRMLPAIHERMQVVQIEHQDWRTILESYNHPDYLAYLDPPYVHSTRSSGEYQHEMINSDHKELIEQILKYPGMVMLSGYENDIYKILEERGWNLQKFETACHAAGKTRHTKIQGEGSALKTQPRIECVWRNPRAMAAFGNDLFAGAFK